MSPSDVSAAVSFYYKVVHNYYLLLLSCGDYDANPAQLTSESIIANVYPVCADIDGANSLFLCDISNSVKLYCSYLLIYDVTRLARSLLVKAFEIYNPNSSQRHVFQLV